ncbi:cobalamin biosynthesis protein CbiG [Lachnospiraceae bacterium]|nr:cobalamin biosynthesis protein CbiG [Lachnospiraceae bacterium]
MKRQEIQVSIISFTEAGSRLAKEIKGILEDCPQSGQWLAQGRREDRISVSVQESKKVSGSLKEWVGQAFVQSKVLIFVGAVGIAVRLTAGFIRDKYKDPAVLAIDEMGRFVIPVLSGHVGGANDCARYLARKLAAVPVITTATDLYGKFAVDVFAVKNGLILSDRRLAKEISAAALRGEQIGFFCEKEVFGSLPQELAETGERLEDRKKETERYKIHVGVHDDRQDGRTLFLHPRVLALGIGCRKGSSMEEIERFIREKFKEGRLAWDSICAVASVDLKKQEKGLLAFCEKWQFPFCTFSAGELAQLPGTFTESEFVAEITGVGNVCERAAMRCVMALAGERSQGQSEPEYGLILKKTAEHGITLAVAQVDWSVAFE